MKVREEDFALYRAWKSFRKLFSNINSGHTSHNIVGNDNSIRLFYTGGTIGGVLEKEDAAVGKDRTQGNFESLIRKRIPTWARRYSWSISSPYRRKLSENNNPNDWIELAKAVNDAICEGVNGIVIAHGTDTLAYSSAALSAMLINPPIPIVLTGSNLPLEHPNTDAVQNISHSFFLACSSRIHGIVICFTGDNDGESLILPGDNAQKYGLANGYFKFKPFSGSAIGRITNSKNNQAEPTLNIDPFADARFLDYSTDGYEAHFGMNPNIALFNLFPGLEPRQIDCAVDGGARAIILAAYGAGTFCSDDSNWSMTQSLARARRSGIDIFVTSQHGGIVNLSEYASSKILQDLGCIPLKNWSIERCIVNVMWWLAIADSNRRTLSDVANEYLDSTHNK